jgi:SAM-dependent methyltransferase
MGAAAHRRPVGPPGKFDAIGIQQFATLVEFGLRPHHDFLDVGCGCLRAGRFFIAYLEPGRYRGVDPAGWLIEAGLAHELGAGLADAKRPEFSTAGDGDFSGFGTQFDYALSFSVFVHMPLADVAATVAGLGEALRPGGMFVGTFMPGGRDYAGEAWEPRIAFYREDTLAEVARGAGLEFAALGLRPPCLQHWFVMRKP